MEDGSDSDTTDDDDDDDDDEDDDEDATPAGPVKKNKQPIKFSHNKNVVKEDSGDESE
jgi:hypothetical protein